MVWFIGGVIASFLIVWLAGRGRLQEMQRAVNDARQREDEAKKASEAAVQDLRKALEEKGRFQAEAARFEEVKREAGERDRQIAELNGCLMLLDREKTNALKDAEAAAKQSEQIVAKEREAIAEILKAKEQQIEKLNEFISQSRDVLSKEFKALSSDVLRDASKQLLETADGLIKKHGEKTSGDVELHKEQIEKMLKPVEETMKRLDQHVESSNLERSKAEALLDEQVKRLAGASESLSNALRKPVIRGSWGEMTLENALENAGLRANIDYVLQHTTDGEDGRLRTDAVVNLPKGRKLIIDSKNMMESYIAYSNATDDAQRTILGEAHSRALRFHIKDLSSKKYMERYEGPDCVILFIPHDGMYHAAIQDESELIREACEKRVFVANPMSLIPLLKAVAYVLDQERANKSAAEIQRVAMELYSDLARFAEKMANIGSKLQASVKAYNDAIPGLDRYILAKSRTLKQMGGGKGAEPELPEPVDLEPRLFSSRELKSLNPGEEIDLEIAAASGVGEID